MKIAVAHKQDVAGVEIRVDVTAEGPQRIRNVETKHNASRLEHIQLPDDSISYGHTYPAVGAFPDKHTVVVTVEDTTGSTYSHTEVWRDS